MLTCLQRWHVYACSAIVGWKPRNSHQSFKSQLDMKATDSCSITRVMTHPFKFNT